MIDETYNELGKKIKTKKNKIFQLKSIIKNCRERGKWDLAIKLCKKYNLKQVNEDYYD